MSEEFTLTAVNEALSNVISSAIPGVTVYDNPNQENTAIPAVFLNYRGEQGIQKQIGNRWMRKLRYDVVYMAELNLPNLNDLYRSAAEALDYHLEEIPFGNEEICAINRTWFVELDSLHYQFDIFARVSKPYAPTYMQSAEIKEEIKE